MDQRVACQCSSSTAAISEKWAICRMLPQWRACQVLLQWDVTITAERQTHSVPSNDPLQKSTHSKRCTARTVIQAEKSATKRIRECRYMQPLIVSHLTAWQKKHRKERNHLCSITEKNIWSSLSTKSAECVLMKYEYNTALKTQAATPLSFLTFYAHMNFRFWLMQNILFELNFWEISFQMNNCRT